MKLSKSRKLQQISICRRSNETNPFDNQLSIALCRDVNMTMWHVRTHCDGMMSVFVINYCCCVTLMKDYDNWTERVFDDQMTEWGLDCRWPGQWSGPWHDYCPHTWGIISQPDIIVVIIVRRFGWKLWQSLPRWAQPGSGYFAPNYPAVTEISCSLTKCHN